MAKVCIVFGIVLCLLGLGGYFGTGRESVTALIPALFGLPGFLEYVQGGEVERPAAVIVQTVMAALCAIFVVLSIKSFVDVRRARAQAPAR